MNWRASRPLFRLKSALPRTTLIFLSDRGPQWLDSISTR
jgi:hypothetical protein